MLEGNKLYEMSENTLVRIAVKGHFCVVFVPSWTLSTRFFALNPQLKDYGIMISHSVLSLQ